MAYFLAYIKLLLQSSFRNAIILLSIFIIDATLLKAQTYKWDNVAMGGGGFVTGLILSKTQQNLMYARTDVGGAYRWDAANNKWLPLLDWNSESETTYQGVESFAIDPQDNNKLYILAGTSYWNNGKTAILKSVDKGNSFTITDVTTQFKAHGNGSGRSNGEKLVVDPNNSNILFCGTRRNGLFKSIDAGATWVQNSSLGTIVTPNDNGISFILFDATTATTGNATQKIFVGISAITGTNFYVSSNGGTTFTAVAGAPATLMPQKAVLASDKNLYITYADKEGPSNASTGEVWKYNTQTLVWTNITPAGAAYPYSGVNVDPNNPQKIIIGTINKYLLQYGPATGGTYGDRFYLTTDGGTTWKNLIGTGITLDPNGCTWIAGQSIHWGGNIEFNPFNTNEAWVISGNGVFVCNDINATPTTWKFAAKGMEETVCNDLVSITGGPTFSVISDYDGFKHSDVTQFSPIHTPRMGTTNGIAYATLNTNKLARVGNKIFYTTDQGANWIQTAAINGSGGKVALSANGNILLHGPNASATTYRSADNGISWSACNGLAISSAIPVADAVNSSKFYVYDNTNGNVYVSIDGGVNFSVAGNAGTGGNKKIRTVPGQEGHLWVALYNGGLKRSVNSGSTFTSISNVTACSAVGLGKASPAATYFTIYIWGTVNGVLGLHRSIDEGVTWVRVNDDAHEYGGPGNGQFVIGDMNVFGRVYMSTVGRGIAYGELQASPLTTAFSSFTAAIKNIYFTELVWKTATEANTNTFEVERSADGINFIKTGAVATQAVNGNSNVPLSYTCDDNILGISGTIYYRIKHVDKNNAVIYSNIVNVVKPAMPAETFSVFPNPAGKDNFNVKIKLNLPQDVQISVVDVKGRVVYKGAAISLLAGEFSIKVKDMKELCAGMYVVELASQSNGKIIGRQKIFIK
jgi:xyloglucan-specific exo-beta-1,4-glucanase